MNVETLIQAANQRLKQAKLGVLIERRHESLCLRATLPPKPGTNRPPSQQRISLRPCKASPAGVKHAETQAKILAGELLEGTFDWSEWLSDRSSGQEVIGDWVQKFETNYWNINKRTQQSLTTWDTDYNAVLSKLPQDQVMSMNLLKSLALTTEPDSRSRKRFCMVLGALAKFAELPGVESLKELSGKYSPSEVTPRDLPTDEAISQWRSQIKSDGWRWVFGMMAAYGLRNHEVFRASLVDFPTVRIPRETKTKARFVYPLFPEWVEQWNLKERVLPNLQNIEAASNAKLGTKVSGFFYDNKCSFTAYDIRHCFARRCFEFGFSPDLGAKLMGHSVVTHTRIYRAWIDEMTYWKIYDAIVNRPGRPEPPQR